MHARSVFRYIFRWLRERLGIRGFRGHTFFGVLLSHPAVVADFGAHRGEFFSALKSEYSISRAMLIEANPRLAERLKETLGTESDVVHAALVGGNRGATILFTRSSEPEASSIFREWAPAYGITDQLDVPAMDLSKVIRELGGRVDLAKFDVEGAGVDVLQTASASDLASCCQLTVEFHDMRPPITRRDVDRVYRRLRSEGYGVVSVNWPQVDDVLFVNLKTMPAAKRMAFRFRLALANALFITRRVIFDRSSLKRI